MDRNLALEFVRVTESAAIAAARFIGRGDGKLADLAAVSEMRARFNQVDFNAMVVIGEGRKDEAPELYVGEKLGTGKGEEFDIAVDPLECTDSVAFGRYNAISVIATGPKGSLLCAPDTYMEKIAVGPKAKDVIDLNASVEENLSQVAKALDKPVSEITVMMLDRKRHDELINKVRAAGARIRLISDGDVAGAIATCIDESGVDILMGIGASAEAVLASTAIRVLGGEMLCRFAPRNDEDEVLIKKMGCVISLDQVLNAADLAKGGNITFTATGVIDGPLLRGVREKNGMIITHSVVMRKASNTVRYIEAEHRR